LGTKLGFDELAETVRQRGLRDWVRFEGPRAMSILPEIYGSAFLHLNLSETGSIDKAILEALSCGCPTLTSNAAAFPLLEQFPALILGNRTPEAVGRRITHLYDHRHEYRPADLRGLVTGRHDIESYTDRVYRILAGLARN
jgi:glycosyltransferase involved in cell wall biosynthesis